jgi:hypothetical protein
MSMSASRISCQDQQGKDRDSDQGPENEQDTSFSLDWDNPIGELFRNLVNGKQLT